MDPDLFIDLDQILGNQQVGAAVLPPLSPSAQSSDDGIIPAGLQGDEDFLALEFLLGPGQGDVLVAPLPAAPLPAAPAPAAPAPAAPLPAAPLPAAPAPAAPLPAAPAPAANNPDEFETMAEYFGRARAAVPSASANSRSQRARTTQGDRAQLSQADILRMQHAVAGRLASAAGAGLGTMDDAIKNDWHVTDQADVDLISRFTNSTIVGVTPSLDVNNLCLQVVQTKPNTGTNPSSFDPLLRVVYLRMLLGVKEDFDASVARYYQHRSAKSQSRPPTDIPVIRQTVQNIVFGQSMGDLFKAFVQVLKYPSMGCHLIARVYQKLLERNTHSAGQLADWLSRLLLAQLSFIQAGNGHAAEQFMTLGRALVGKVPLSVEHMHVFFKHTPQRENMLSSLASERSALTYVSELPHGVQWDCLKEMLAGSQISINREMANTLFQTLNQFNYLDVRRDILFVSAPNFLLEMAEEQRRFMMAMPAASEQMRKQLELCMPSTPVARRLELALELATNPMILSADNWLTTGRLLSPVATRVMQDGVRRQHDTSVVHPDVGLALRYLMSIIPTDHQFVAMDFTMTPLTLPDWTYSAEAPWLAVATQLVYEKQRRIVASSPSTFDPFQRFNGFVETNRNRWQSKTLRDAIMRTIFSVRCLGAQDVLLSRDLRDFATPNTVSYSQLARLLEIVRTSDDVSIGGEIIALIRDQPDARMPARFDVDRYMFSRPRSCVDVWDGGYLKSTFYRYRATQTHTWQMQQLKSNVWTMSLSSMRSRMPMSTVVFAPPEGMLLANALSIPKSTGSFIQASRLLKVDRQTFTISLRMTIIPECVIIHTVSIEWHGLVGPETLLRQISMPDGIVKHSIDGIVRLLDDVPLIIIPHMQMMQYLSPHIDGVVYLKGEPCAFVDVMARLAPETTEMATLRWDRLSASELAGRQPSAESIRMNVVRNVSELRDLLSQRTTQRTTDDLVAAAESARVQLSEPEESPPSDDDL